MIHSQLYSTDTREEVLASQTAPSQEMATAQKVAAFFTKEAQELQEILETHRVDEKRETALHSLASTFLTDEAERLLKEGVRIEAKDHKGQTALYHAAKQKNLKMIGYLMDKGGSLFNKALDGKSAFDVIIQQEDKSFIRAFIEENGLIALAQALEQKAYTSAMALVQAGVPLKFIPAEITNRALARAHVKEDKKRIKCLHKLNISLKRNVKEGEETPLHISAKKGSIKWTKKFLQYGDINAQDLYGETALYKACKEGHLEVVKLLLSKGARVDITTYCGNNLLHAAYMQGNVDLVCLLKEAYPHLQRQKNSLGQVPHFVFYAEPIKRKEKKERIKWLSHVFSLKGSLQLNQQSVNLEGAHPQAISHFILKTLKQYGNRGGYFLEENYKLLLKIFKRDVEGIAHYKKEVLEEMKKGLPVLVSVRSSNHSIKILFFKGMLLILNRGRGADGKTAAAYKIDINKVDEQILDKLLEVDHTEEFNRSFFYEELPLKLASSAPLTSQEEELFALIKKHAPAVQKGGHCAFDSAKSARFYINLLLEIDRSGSGSKEELKQAEERAIEAARHLSTYERMFTFEENLEVVRRRQEVLNTGEKDLFYSAWTKIVERVKKDYRRSWLSLGNLTYFKKVKKLYTEFA